MNHKPPCLIIEKLTFIKFLIWKMIFCPLGKHIDQRENANFCSACGHQLNPSAHSDYLVTLSDGTQLTVNAINIKHAKSLVVYGNSLSIDGVSGTPKGMALIHPYNVKSAIKKQ